MRWLTLVLLVPLAAGCLSATPQLQAQRSESSPAAEPRVVVGVADSGINPYHEQFRDPEATLPADFIDATTGQRPITLRLSQEGSFEERVVQDREHWQRLKPRTLYWFQGTRLLGISFADSKNPPLVLDDSPYHGTGVASTVRSVSPQAWIVIVQVADDVDTLVRDGPSTFHENFVAGVAWLGAQPWVDVVSLSIGLQSNPPLFWELIKYTEVTRSMVDSGKLVVNSAGNLPTPNTWSGTGGPPWVIAVGGALPSSRGEVLLATKFIDVVADYERVAASREPDAYDDYQGTSFATPLVAGNLAQALLELRSKTGHLHGIAEGVLCSCYGRNITSSHMRQAMNWSATYWNVTDYRSSIEPQDPSSLFRASAPVLPAPWVQMGWGYVGDDTWRTMVAVLLGEPPPPKPAEAGEYMARQQELRELYWSKEAGSFLLGS